MIDATLQARLTDAENQRDRLAQRVDDLSASKAMIASNNVELAVENAELRLKLGMYVNGVKTELRHLSGDLGSIKGRAANTQAKIDALSKKLKTESSQVDGSTREKKQKGIE